MPIPVSCPCGRSANVKDELAGRKVRCPKCGTVLMVPQPETDLEVVDEEEAAYGLLDENALPKKPRKADEDDDEYDRRERRRQAEEADRREQRRDEEREEKRRRKHERQEDVRRQERLNRPRVEDGGGGRKFGTSEAGVIGGIVMILGAIVWFVLGLKAGYIFFYPPILAVLGIAAIIKGLAGR